MKIRHAYVEARKQHSVGSGNGKFGGPDVYVAVQIVPSGTNPLRVLNAKHAKTRGITIKYFGEGYSRHDGPSSMYGQALDAAEEFASAFNCRQDDEFNFLVHHAE